MILWIIHDKLWDDLYVYHLFYHFRFFEILGHSFFGNVNEFLNFFLSCNRINNIFIQEV